jgi:NAD(P)-dependent dehydrogenase (short-subunit alcohol dehydrogenase family)
MHAKLKPLADQVIVITGAGSGLGLALARRAATAGAAVVLTGRDEALLRQAADQINAGGGRAHPVVGDMTDAEEVARIARAAAARFGGFDTWINDPGAYDLGVANGAREAARHFRDRPGGGAIVNLSTTPSKLTDTLRRELRDAPVSLTQIRLPSGARGDDASDVTLAAALHAAAHPVRRMTVGRGGRLSIEAQKHRGLILGVGVVALAAAAVWYGRGRIARTAAPMLGRALRPMIVRAALRRPVRSARLAVRHPRQALKLAAALRG